MVKREPTPIDNRRSLFKKNPVTSAGVERMRREKSPGSRELERRARDGENLRRALKKGGTEIGVERKERGCERARAGDAGELK
ncbi:hypothetical protein TNCV_960841 [Trichonephila clavipes]|nr:hypothetical protein TNCV_960841 [Trichonephila clavipes]